MPNKTVEEDHFVKEKTGTLKVAVRELEEHLRKTYSDNQRHVPATIPDDMPPIQPPEHQLDTRPPTWSKVKNTVKRARTASAPGPNGVPYRLYKNTPGVLKGLWKLMKVTWEKGIIPKAWRKHPMRPGCTTDEVSYWRHQAVIPQSNPTQKDISNNSACAEYQGILTSSPNKHTDKNF
ncbi:hypothetical protein F2P81_002506 [Scophthalmus maximus]|uniref:Uncharacterized protein n=1 Tax=Scophthalmus maximus TaxID=52904 RepID=A0A6A4TGZ1_SCOMX|nr:hypothetical protein F2P81_002506 [Scophthalmus maximus]